MSFVLLYALEQEGVSSCIRKGKNQTSKAIYSNCSFNLLCSCVKEECGTIKFWLEPGWRGNRGKFSPSQGGLPFLGVGRSERALVNASFTGHRLTQTRASKQQQQHRIPHPSSRLSSVHPNCCFDWTLISLVSLFLFLIWCSVQDWIYVEFFLCFCCAVASPWPPTSVALLQRRWK